MSSGEIYWSDKPMGYRQLGDEAHSLQLSLSVEPAHSSLFGMLYFESRVAGFVLEASSSATEHEAKRQVGTYLAMYHEALPFSEAERRWLANLHSRAYTDPAYEWRVAKSIVAL